MKPIGIIVLCAGIVVALGAMSYNAFVQPKQSTVESGVVPPIGSPQDRLPRPNQPPMPPRETKKPRDVQGSNAPVSSEAVTTSTTSVAAPVAVTQKTLDDSVSTLSNPVKVATNDGQEYFMIGQPKGQNAKQPRKIIFSLPGHGSTAEQDYNAWKSHLTGGDYALASLNWWHGGGEKLTDYYRPDEVLREIRAFLDTYGYAQDDFVVLEGFSRGSANTYSVKAYDIVSGDPVIDAVISASGKYQSDFPLKPDQSAYNNGKLYQNVPWILACGVKDEKPERDGCIGMQETKEYLVTMGANVLKVLEDPNGSHGAFHKSPLKLPEQAMKLLNTLPAAQ